MESIKKGDTVLGIILRNIPAGSVPMTEGTEPLQVVTLKHPSGTHLQAHRHDPRERTTSAMHECLVVVKGKVRIGIYDKEGELFVSRDLGAGEAYLSMNGGIGIDIVEDAEVIEIKNGPFVEDKILL